MIFCSDPGIVHAEIKPVDIPTLFLIRKIEILATILQQLIGKSCAIVLVGIGPDMEPDKMECIGRMVDVLQLERSIQGMLFIVQTNVDGIVNFLLPVVGLREDGGLKQ
jgi:hypothetical protein